MYSHCKDQNPRWREETVESLKTESLEVESLEAERKGLLAGTTLFLSTSR